MKMSHSLRITAVLCAVAAAVVCEGAEPQQDQSPYPDRYNVVWKTPSKDHNGSMPIGNGEIGLNLWVEPGGDLVFYIARTDAWSGNGRLLKLGRVRVKLEPPLVTQGQPFKQELRLRQGEIAIESGQGEKAKTVRVWVDANRPVIRVEVNCKQAVQFQAGAELWRTAQRRLSGKESHSVRALQGGPPIVVEPDTIAAAANNQVRWYHRNPKSCYGVVLKNQHLGSLLEKYPDPLINRTFGCAMLGAGLAAKDNKTLVSAAAGKQFALSVYPLTAQTKTSEAWGKMLDEQVAAGEKTDLERARAAHRQWWRAFWNRSWIFIGSAADAETVTRGYTLQRWINACAGRGNYPIKFNGTIFTVDGAGFDADYRQWGGNYWFQNTRLPYWSMLAAGDYDLMQPLWKMYLDALGMARDKTRLYYKHGGAFFPETMYFWGTYGNCDFGWRNKSVTTTNSYIRYYWSSSIELTMMMLDNYDHTRDKAFAKETMLPLAEAFMAFFDQHWKRGKDGKIFFSPAASLETWHVATNPLPEIVGLRVVLSRLLGLPEDLTTEVQRKAWKRTLQDLPEVPMRQEGGKGRLLPAKTRSQHKNSENPELYAVFPYRLYGVGKPQPAIAIETWKRRRVKGTGGWRQDSIQAAYLGLAEEARRYISQNFKTHHRGSRFPAFWGPNFDWIPDQDHGGVAMTALQRMVLQCEGNKILLLPAWPKQWDLDFKLHAPMKTTVEGTVRGGKVVSVKVQPESRKKDLVVMQPQ
ncbi:MAG: hypothetical protein ISS78_10920 [Phycisphaerae bacterium]|nr:hypothetical protein [Phycisphaerae bacterium]